MQISQFYSKPSLIIWGIFVFFSAGIPHVSGQTPDIDPGTHPLSNRLQAIIEQDDTYGQFKSLMGLSRAYSDRMNAFTVQYIRDSLEELSINDSIVPAAVHFLIGEFLNVNLQNFSRSLVYYDKAYELLPSGNEVLRLRILQRIAALSLSNNRLEEAIAATDSCIEAARRLNAWFPLAHCLNCKADIRRDYFLEIPEQIPYYREALEYYKLSFRENAVQQDTLSALLTLYFITSINLEIDTIFPREEAYLDTASTFITPDKKFDDFRAQNWFLRGQLRSKRGNFEAALDTFTIALQQFEQNEDTVRMVQTHYFIADILQKQNKPELVVDTLTTALSIAHKVNSDGLKQRIYTLLFQAHKQLGNTAEALAAHEALFETTIQDNLTARNRLLMGQEARYGLEEKQQEIREKQQELTEQSKNNRKLRTSNLLMTLLVILLLFSFIRARNNRNKLRARNATIIEQKQQLEEMDNMKSRFFTNISHELKTPLALIKAPLEYLQQRTKISPEGTSMLETALRNTRRLEQLVHELLDFSKIESGNTTLQLRPLNAQVLLQQIIEGFEPLAQSRDLQLIFDCNGEEPILAQADPSAFQKVMTNLISNAIKFSPAGGKVLIELSGLENHTVVSVQDQGPGIYPDDLAGIFDRFHQSAHKDVPKNNSTGIGLALSRELARLMKGDLNVESVREKGATFTLRLIRPQRPLSEPVIPHEPSAGPARGVTDQQDIYQILADIDNTTSHILIVEDHEDLRNYLVGLLGQYFQVHTAPNGQEALELLSAGDTLLTAPGKGLIISDLMMPVMDGFELLNALKASPEFQDIPTIMLTARHGQSERLTALTIGVDDYLVKPFDNQELLIRVHNLMTRYREKARLAPLAGEARHDEPMPQGVGQNHRRLDPEQLNWLKDLETFAIKHISDSQFNVSFLSSYANMSERNFLRHIKKATGLTPSEYIKEIRLHHARRLLENGEIKSVKAVSRAVGFNSHEYFSDLFHQRFGRRPSTYLT